MNGKNVRGLLSRLRRLLRRDPDTEDPYVKVRVPLKKGPGSQSAAVALKEPRN